MSDTRGSTNHGAVEAESGVPRAKYRTWRNHIAALEGLGDTLIMNHFIDFEATQFTGEIISIGCVDENDRQFYTLVKPEKAEDIKDEAEDIAEEVSEAAEDAAEKTEGTVHHSAPKKNGGKNKKKKK